MFLYTRQEKPFIAEHDIDCYVYIRKEVIGENKNEHGLTSLFHKLLRKTSKHIPLAVKYYEPFRNIKLTPNSLMKPKNKRVYSGEFNGRHHYRIEDGYVHGMLRQDYYGVAQPYSATIPAGSEFYVNDGLFRVASDQMLIGSIATLPLDDWSEMIEQITPQLAEEMFGYDDEVKPGFYYTSYKYINPNKLKESDISSICGVVTHVDGKKITVMSLNEKDLIWCPESKFGLINKKAKTDGEHRFNEYDDDGAANTLNVIRSDNYDIDFAAVSFCNKYNIHTGISGAWHLGASSEVIHAVRENMLAINVAIAMLKTYPLLDTLAYYWTSTEYEDDYALAIDGSDGCVIGQYKNAHCRVRAFMTLDKPLQW